MTLTDAVNSIVQSSTKNAAKRPAMGGYVFVTDKTTNPTTGALTGYKLVFRKRASEGAGSTLGTGDYAFTYTVSTGKYTTTDSLTLDAELLGEMLGDDWQTGTLADLENARTGTDDTW